MIKKKGLNYAKFGYLFSIPFVVAYLLFSFYPVIYTFVIAFTDLTGTGKNQELHFLTGDIFANFKSVLHNDLFIKSFGNTVKLWVCNFIPQMGLALLLTAWFTDRRSTIKGQGFFKVVFYLPNIITAATVAILFGSLFAFPIGPVNDLRESLGAEKLDYFAKPAYAQAIVIFIQTWMWFGYTMITLISGVIGIDPSIYEAAEMDGANRVQTFFHITIPNIRTIMLFTLVTSLIGGLNMFDIPKLLVRQSGPDFATQTTSVFIQNRAFGQKPIRCEAAAASILMFLLIVVCSAILFFIMRDKDAAAAKKLKKQAIKAAKAQGV